MRRSLRSLKVGVKRSNLKEWHGLSKFRSRTGKATCDRDECRARNMGISWGYNWDGLEWDTMGIYLTILVQSWLSSC